MSSVDKKKVDLMVAGAGKNASTLNAILLDSQFDAAGVFIADPALRAQSIGNAAMASDSIFSHLGDRGREVAIIWAQDLASHTEKNGGVSDFILSSAYQQLEAIVNGKLEGGESNMILSAMNSETLSTSKGLEIRANTAALVLPVMLANPLNDVVVYLPNPAKLMAEIFNIINVTGSKFGDFDKGVKLTPFSSGQYSSARQRYAFQTVPNGTLTTFAFAVANTPQGVAMPIRKKSVGVFVNKQKVLTDYSGQSVSAGTIKIAATTYTLTLASADYATGVLSLTSAPALPTGVTIHAEYEVDMEKNPDLIPLVDQQFESFTLIPFFRYLGSNTTVQSTLMALSEHGINTRSSMLASAKHIMANEKALQQLAQMYFSSMVTESFNVPAPVNGEWREAWELFQAILLKLDTNLLAKTERAGLTHMYCAPNVVNFLRMLGPMLEVAPGYVREARIHYVGTFNGGIKIYEVPFPAVIPAGKALCIAKSTDLGRAAYVTGDVVAPTVITQDSGRGFLKQDSIMSLGYDEVHPNGGSDFLAILDLPNLSAVGL
jgi:hypothetical protein